MKYRISIIHYSNTIPFVYGLSQSEYIQKHAELLYHYPSQGVDLLSNSNIDICIVPIAAIPHIANAHIITNFCIGAYKKVASVSLYSNRPITEISKITLDYQSRTSNLLTKILAHKRWNISPQYIQGSKGYERNQDGSAKVIIGDRALLMKKDFLFDYDLSEEWYKTFQLPFVFACWVANKPISIEFIEEFENALRLGIENIDQAIAHSNSQAAFDMHDYLHNNIDYVLDDVKRKAMKTFYEEARKIGKL